MAKLNSSFIRACLDTLYFSGAHHVARPFLAGVGAILTFHRVRPAIEDPFQPNDLLEITPDYLDGILKRLRADGIEIVPLDEVHRRLREADFSRRFVALTFDDGYRDNRDHALPVLRRHKAPFTVFVSSSFADGTGELWWVALERAIAVLDEVELTMDGHRQRFPTKGPAGKIEAFQTIYPWLRALPSEEALRQVVRDLAQAASIDIASICRELCMDWDELREFGRDPLVSFGSHTANHIFLSKADEPTAEREIRLGNEAIERHLGVLPQHFAYPVGAADAAGPREFGITQRLGFKTATTTRPGVLFADHADHLTALPRLSINGGFQRLRYFNVLLSGAPTALFNRFRRIAA